MNKNNNIKTLDRWVPEKMAADYYHVKPATIKANRLKYGHNGSIVWAKLNGKVLIDIFETDKKITMKEIK
jgi:hypothetical protein